MERMLMALMLVCALAAFAWASPDEIGNQLSGTQFEEDEYHIYQSNGGVTMVYSKQNGQLIEWTNDNTQTVISSCPECEPQVTLPTNKKVMLETETESGPPIRLILFEQILAHPLFAPWKVTNQMAFYYYPSYYIDCDYEYQIEGAWIHHTWHVYGLTNHAHRAWV